VRCLECGLLFVNPQPEPGVLKAYYPGEYYSVPSRRFREYSRLRKRVLEEYFGYGARSKMPQGLRLLRKALLFPFKLRYRDAIPYVKGGRLLDIGCGNGTELYKLRALGWETYGVEPAQEASERARSRGLSVFTGDLMEASFPDRFFDVIRMSFVLEHLPNPKETLVEIRRILRPRGRIYLSIPNARSLLCWLFAQNWFSLDLPRHLFLFSPKTIGRLLSSLDLPVKTIRFDSGTRSLLGSLQYWTNDRHHRAGLVDGKQVFFESHFLKHLVRPLCWCVDRLGLGDAMHVEVVQG
jgi:SAM-dependent methyltransferase